VSSGWQTGSKVYLKVGQGDAMLRIMNLAQKEIPEAELARFRFEFFDDRNDRLPSSCVIRQLGPGQSLRGPDLPLYTRRYRMNRDEDCVDNALRTSRKVMSFARVSLA
jgi:hypothetical protein